MLLPEFPAEGVCMARLVAALFVCLVCFVAGLLNSSALAAKKFLMPGEYKTKLCAGEYWIWDFKIWKSQGINECKVQRKNDLSIRNLNGRELRQVPFRDCIYYRDDDHFGTREHRISINKSGTFLITSANLKGARGVVVIARREEHVRDLGSNIIPRDLLVDDFEKSSLERK